MEAWHFVGDKLRDGRDVPPNGVTLAHVGPLVIYKSGLHASLRAIDALHYAPTRASWLCRVRCEGETIEGTDNLVCRERTILWRVPCDPMMRDFARWCARSVLHFWDAPRVVKDYLDSGDENAGAAAWSTDWAAAVVVEWAAQNNELERLVNETHNQGE